MSDEKNELDGVDDAATKDVLKELRKDIDRLDVRTADQKKAILKILDLFEAASMGGPWLWEELTESQTTLLWRQLTGFVEWLDGRYLRHTPKLRLPACWYRHPAVVGQLTALMVAHVAVYNKGAASASMHLVDWHERALWPTLERIFRNEQLHECQAGHQTRQIPDLLKREEDLQRLLEMSARSGGGE